MDKGHEATEADRRRQQTIDALKHSTQQQQQPAIKEAISTITLQDLAHINEVPCARQALLYGVGSACLLGATKFFWTRRVGHSLNWGAGTFVAMSLATFEGCRFQRFQERNRMKYAVDRVEIRRQEKSS
ncbi:hypothetical protein BCR37DRAFT_378741 [Protomyces lactucae-debilis]|uniref:Cytochrome c oxidase assembly protein COX20, mitochondrial n=1 Tax=Protomyces lactucae-debilis TaxID=2754530 RepID=A0A1Y2FIJ2_PROLT|nr:uncharacterized protein BCR37DRAFT_378741 [Protomyces lactucae-debilis]ORY83759.1 hypothetical protein BCR37DRAFT_378741 [Protomyces lactucae-debilis]